MRIVGRKKLKEAGIDGAVVRSMELTEKRAGKVTPQDVLVSQDGDLLDVIRVEKVGDSYVAITVERADGLASVRHYGIMDVVRVWSLAKLSGGEVGMRYAGEVVLIDS